MFPSIWPFAADINFYRFTASPGNTLLADIVTSLIYTVMGIWHSGPPMPDGKPGDWNTAMQAEML